MSETIADWRSTPEGRFALTVFSRRVIREELEPALTGLFTDDAARRRFARHVRDWARTWHRSSPLGAGRRKSARLAWHGKLSAADAQLLRKAAKLARDLDLVLCRLSPTAIAAITAERDEGGLELPARPDRAAAFATARLAVSRLSSASAPLREVTAARGRRDEPHKRAIMHIGRIFQDVTGNPPKRRVRAASELEGQPYGPFKDLVDQMIPRLWPQVESCDGLIEDVCNKLAEKAPISVH
jgi:hypothetical protein